MQRSTIRCDVEKKSSEEEEEQCQEDPLRVYVNGEKWMANNKKNKASKLESDHVQQQ
jgi:hypothetical protein